MQILHTEVGSSAPEEVASACIFCASPRPSGRLRNRSVELELNDGTALSVRLSVDQDFITTTIRCNEEMANGKMGENGQVGGM